MSRRDGRDSDSRRHRPRFDSESGPKRSRRDEKDERDESNLEGSKKTDKDLQDQKQRRKLPDALGSDAKVEAGAPKNEPDTKLTKNSSDGTEVPRSRSHFQHDEHGGQAIRSSGRSSTSEHGYRRDSKDQHDDKTVRKTTNDSRPRHDKHNGDENRTWRHDRYSEKGADPPAARKRPAFRENKALLESETEKTAVETTKSSHLDRSMEGSRNKEERNDNRRHLDRSEKLFGADRVRYKGEAQRGVFPPRERYTNVNAARNFRGRDRFGEKQGYRSTGGRVEKWEHDLYLMRLTGVPHQKMKRIKLQR